MFGVKPTLVTLKRILAVRGFHHRSRGKAVAVPLFPAFPNANGLAAFCSLRGAEFRMHEPHRLCQEYEQKHAGKELRASKAFTSEIREHKVEPSVLPCRRLFAKLDP